jgi:hypothetical protein
MFGSLIPVLGLIAVMIALFVESYYFGFSMLDYSMKKQHKMAVQIRNITMKNLYEIVVKSCALMSSENEV